MDSILVNFKWQALTFGTKNITRIENHINLFTAMWWGFTPVRVYIYLDGVLSVLPMRFVHNFQRSGRGRIYVIERFLQKLWALAIRNSLPYRKQCVCTVTISYTIIRCVLKFKFFSPTADFTQLYFTYVKMLSPCMIHVRPLLSTGIIELEYNWKTKSITP